MVQKNYQNLRYQAFSVKPMKDILPSAVTKKIIRAGFDEIADTNDRSSLLGFCHLTLLGRHYQQQKDLKIAQ